MPQRKKTRQEIAQQIYLTQTDIKVLFCISPVKAKRIYDLANTIDSDKTKLLYRVEPTKVRITSVSKVTGVTVEMIKKQAGVYGSTKKDTNALS